MTDLHRSKPTAWQALAECAGSHPAQWFPELHSPHTHAQIAQAKVTCRRCRCRAACLEYAQTEPYEIHGIWGGFTPAERQRLRITGRTS